MVVHDYIECEECWNAEADVVCYGQGIKERIKFYYCLPCLAAMQANGTLPVGGLETYPL
jgi:hypothetical protein